MAGHDPFALERFISAQDDNYDDAIRELRQGRKRTHWIWYVFPQLKGLGASAKANFFGIGGRAEAGAYLAHAVLGARLRECTTALRAVSETDIQAIMGYPDDLKLLSSMTLFAEIARDPADRELFKAVLDRFFDGKRDRETLRRLGSE